MLAVTAAPVAASTPPRAPVASTADYGDEPGYEDAEPVPEDDPEAAPAPVAEQPVGPPPIPFVPFEHGPQAPPAPLYPPLVTSGTVPGRVAQLRTNGKAAIPRGAPLRVRAIIAAANRIIGRRYKWGGGHARLNDTGYDCSGTVSYALIRAGLLGSPARQRRVRPLGRARRRVVRDDLRQPRPRVHGGRGPASGHERRRRSLGALGCALASGDRAARPVRRLGTSPGSDRASALRALLGLAANAFSTPRLIRC